MTAWHGDLSTIDELITRTELEPELIDIYVEGRRDAEIVQLVLHHAGIEASVFPVADRLDIRSDEVAFLARGNGNRSKVIAAALRMDTELASIQHSTLFIVDADWHSVVGPQVINAPSLFLSDGPSMDHYFYQSSSFQWTLSVGLQRPTWDAQTVRDRLTGPLRDVASARLYLEALNVACIEKFTGQCHFDENDSGANALEIVRRSMNAAGRSSEFISDDVSVQLSEYRSWIEEASHGGRGHDIAVLLIALLRLNGDFAKTTVVEAVIRAGISASDLARTPMFTSLLEKIRSLIPAPSV